MREIARIYSHTSYTFWLIAPFWIAFVCFLISRLSGWSSLAEIYRTNLPFSGKILGRQSAQMRWSMSYGNVLTIGANSDGLFLSTQILFRVGHPALFIPWGEISSIEENNRWAGKLVKLSFSRVPGVYLKISKKLAEELRPATDGVWAWDSAAIR